VRKRFNAEDAVDTRWTQGKTARGTRNATVRSLRVLRARRVKTFLPICALAAVFPTVTQATDPALVQDVAEPFIDLRDGGKLHTPSGFVCPAKIDLFERDTVGEADPQTGADFCAYSALGGVYGTIRFVLLDGPYNAKTSLAPGFVEEEGTGGKRVADGVIPLAVKPGSAAIPVYARTYETGKLEGDRYRVLFTGAQFGNWAVETTIEYTDPRDVAVENEFLHAVYAEASARVVPK
jgi:hypothetical protein